MKLIKFGRRVVFIFFVGKIKKAHLRQGGACPNGLLPPFLSRFSGFFCPTPPVVAKLLMVKTGFASSSGSIFFPWPAGRKRKTLVWLVCWVEFPPSHKTPFRSPDGTAGATFLLIQAPSQKNQSGVVAGFYRVHRRQNAFWFDAVVENPHGARERPIACEALLADGGG